MKHLDNLYKSFAAAVSIILVALVSYYAFGDLHLSFCFIAGSLTVCFAILLYNSVPEWYFMKAFRITNWLIKKKYNFIIYHLCLYLETISQIFSRFFLLETMISFIILYKLTPYILNLPYLLFISHIFVFSSCSMMNDTLVNVITRLLFLIHL